MRRMRRRRRWRMRSIFNVGRVLVPNIAPAKHSFSPSHMSSSTFLVSAGGARTVLSMLMGVSLL